MCMGLRTRSHRRERGTVPHVRAEEIDIAMRDRLPIRRRTATDSHESIGIGIGQRPQQYAVDEREHRQRCAEPEGQRQNRGQRQRTHRCSLLRVPGPGAGHPYEQLRVDLQVAVE